MKIYPSLIRPLTVQIWLQVSLNALSQLSRNVGTNAFLEPAFLTANSLSLWMPILIPWKSWSLNLLVQVFASPVYSGSLSLLPSHLLPTPVSTLWLLLAEMKIINSILTLSLNCNGATQMAVVPAGVVPPLLVDLEDLHLIKLVLLSVLLVALQVMLRISAKLKTLWTGWASRTKTTLTWVSL